MNDPIYTVVKENPEILVIIIIIYAGLVTITEIYKSKRKK